ncbi:MAG: hypothetical protein JWO10_1702 [Microbacteriaceae bacterium]|nr:hypothetical protein [Microbacteriaceae bacterium]
MTDTAASPELAERYGRTPSKKRRDRTWLIVLGSIFAVVVIAWVAWAGLDQAGGSLESEDAGNTIIDSRSVSVNFLVSMPAGNTASCALQVQNEQHAIVGWKVVAIPASTKHTQSFTEIVQSSELGVIGLIYRCWLT